MPRTERAVKSVAGGLSDTSRLRIIPAATAFVGDALLLPGPASVDEKVTPRRAALYFPVRLKFALTLGAAVSCAVFSYHLAGRWIADLTELAGATFAYTAIFSIAIIPGFMNAFLAAGLL